jgi:hypothetical protein
MPTAGLSPELKFHSLRHTYATWALDAGVPIWKVAGMLGGAFGDVADIVFDVGERLSGATAILGTMGTGAAVAAAGLVAVGVAATQIAAAADAAAKRLVETGHAAQIPAEALASLERYRDGTSSLRTETDVLTVSLGSDLAAAVGDVAARFALMLDTIDRGRALLREFTDVVDGYVSPVLRGVMAITSGGSSELLRFANQWVDTGATAVTEANKIEAAAKTAADAVGQLTEVQRQRIAVQKELDDEDAFEASAYAQLGMVIDDVATSTARATTATQARLTAGSQEHAQLLATVQTLEEREALYQRQIGLQDQIARQDAAAAAARAAEAEAQLAYEQRATEAIQIAQQLRADAIEDMRQRAASVAGLAGDLVSGMSDIATQAAERLAAAAANGSAVQQRQALAAFRAAKATQIAAATMEAIRAGISMIPSYSFLPAGAAVPAAAATAALGLAAAVQRINSTKPPSFQRGGLVQGDTPDHRIIQARADEAVITGRGVAALGGRAGVEAVNRGHAAPSAPSAVYVQLDGRQIAAALTDPLGSLLGGAPMGRRPLYG